MSKAQPMKVTCTFFSKNRGKFTAVINKSTLHWKEVIKEFRLFRKIHDEIAIVQQRLNTGYLRKAFRKVCNID